MRSTICLALVAAATFAFSSRASASSILVEFTGVDFTFDGEDISDIGAPDDELTSVTITSDSLDITLTSGVSIDLFIPDVDDIVEGAGGIISDTVSSAAGGSLTLNLPAGDFIAFDLDASTVTLVDTGTFSLSAVASIATSGTVTQSLPFGLEIFDPIDIVFSTFDVSNLTLDSGVVTGFDASNGTGEITASAVVPEPVSGVLAYLAMAVVAGSRRRS